MSRISAEELVKAWIELKTPKRVAEKLGLTAKVVTHRISRLRLRGVDLPRSGPEGRTPTDVAALNAVVDEVLGRKNGRVALPNVSESHKGPEEVYVSPSKPQKVRAAPSGPLADCIRGFDAICVEFLGEPFAPWGGKNARAMAGCLKAAKGDVKAVLERARRMFEDPPDEWTAQNASPWLLESRWTNLAARAHVSPLDKQRARNKANHERIFGVPTPGAVGTLPHASDRTPALGSERGTGGAVV